MTDFRKQIETEFLTLEDVAAAPIRAMIVEDMGMNKAVFDGKETERLRLRISLIPSQKIKLWNPNLTSLQNLSKSFKTTEGKELVGHKIMLSTVKMKGKDIIFATSAEDSTYIKE
jgi:hypothetical protein